jgi:hypothetical protein
MNHYKIKSNVTNISDLLDINDIVDKPKQTYQTDVSDEKIQRHIRGNHVIPSAAGMNASGPPPSHNDKANDIKESYVYNQIPGVPYEQYYTHQVQPDENVLPDYTYYGKMNQGLHAQPNCIMIAEHIQTCPICSQLYNSNTNKLYIMLLAIVSIICILLIKKILDTK